MKGRPTLSVAMATFNGSAFLPEQLASIAAQSVLPNELIVGDDASTDDTVAILERFAAHAPFPVRVHVNPVRLGWRGNFMRATSACGSDLIAFCDQDDFWYPEKIARVNAPFDDEDVLLVHHNADLVDRRGARYDTLQPVTAASQCIAPLARPTDWSNPLGLVMTFRRRLTDYNDLWPSSIDLAKPMHPAAHDQWFYFLATNLGKVVALPERLLGYRQHDGNSVGWTHDTAARRPTHERITEQLDRSIGMLTPFCEILSMIGDREVGRVADLARAAVACNRAYLQLLTERRALYASASTMERLRIVAGLSRGRAYARGPRWGLGRRAWMSDVRYALLRGRSI